MGLDVENRIECGRQRRAYGGAGDDWLFGQLGNDYLDGGADNDVLFGGAANDESFCVTASEVLLKKAV